jgi:hypothetical protein
MKKLYIVISSWDSYSDHYKVNELVCSNLFFAEIKKTELENKYREEVPFPFDWCTEESFLELINHKILDEDMNIFNQWVDCRNKLETFNCCFINEINYYGNGLINKKKLFKNVNNGL